MRSEAGRRAAAAIAFTLALAGSLLARAPVIDRVLAVVSGTIVTLSDVHAAIALGLVNTAGAADPVGSALEQLIERTLMLAEVERYAPPEPEKAQVEARVRDVRARFPGDAAFRDTLTAYGLDEDRLRAIARDDLRLQTYLDQRFASAAEASPDDVQTYYREHASEFTRDGAPLPLAAVEQDIRQRIAADRRRALIDEWSLGLRLRADVIVVPRGD
ncbi:MAG TPA: hypothetical protein VK886_22620 [Vicinamibacterales bacterium]|nr:hypothetical protein [Vicinamibacterales bacterium]